MSVGVFVLLQLGFLIFVITLLGTLYYLFQIFVPSTRLPLSWTRTPLVVFCFILFGPTVFYPLFQWFGVEARGTLDLRQTFLAVMLLAPFIAVINWPFLVLYAVCRSKAEKEWPEIRSVRLAMWFSLVLMSLPNIPVAMVGPEGGQGIGVYIAFFVLLPVPILGFVGWFAGRFFAWVTRAYSTGSVLQDVFQYRVRIGQTLAVISVGALLAVLSSAPAADCQRPDVQAAVSNILTAKGHDEIEKKYSKLFAALKEQKDSYEIAKQQEREIHELGRLSTAMTTFYPDVLEDIRTVSRKPYLNAVTCAARVKANDPSISAYKELEYDVHETIFGALRTTVNF